MSSNRILEEAAMQKTVVQPHRSSLGMDANLAVLIIYIATAVVSWIPYLGWFAWAVPLVFFFLEKSSGFVKFHAVQALGIGILRAVLTIIFNIIYALMVPTTIYGIYSSLGAWAVVSVIATILYIAISLLTLYVLIMAWQWKQVELPIIGPMATKASMKLDAFAQKQGFDGVRQRQQQPYQQQQQYYQQPGQQPYQQPQQQQYYQQPGQQQYNQQPEQPVQQQQYYQQPGQQPYQQPQQPQQQQYYQQPGQPGQQQYQQPQAPEQPPYNNDPYNHNNY